MSDVAVARDGDIDAEVRLGFLAQFRGGDLTARMPLEWTGVATKVVADGLSDLMVANQALKVELARVSRVVGTQGELSQRVAVGGSAHSWAGSMESLISLIEALVRPTSEMQRAIAPAAVGVICCHRFWA